MHVITAWQSHIANPIPHDICAKLCCTYGLDIAIRTLTSDSIHTRYKPKPGSNLRAGLQVPNKEQVLALSEELRARSALPAHVPAVLGALPPGTHPMTQFSTAVLALQARLGSRSGLRHLRPV